MKLSYTIKTLFISALFFASTSYSFEVTSGPKNSAKTCTHKTESAVYMAKVKGACAAIEYISRGYEEIEADYENLFLLTNADEIKLNKFIESAKQEYLDHRVTTSYNVNCSQFNFTQTPYLFVTDSAYCAPSDYNRAGGCFAQEINPGFDMPDTYIEPSTLPKNANYTEDAVVEITFSKVTKNCN